MSNPEVVSIKQLAHRLENATSNERIDALQELQSLARTSPLVVGEHSLTKVIGFLQEQGSSEEYQEALDLLYRLVKCRDKDAAKTNTEIILSDTGHVELFLDLLEHEDLTVGVMTSQILTELHANSGTLLETSIQQCPDGMNKLLQRLPDSSREEVRNQAIVLIQQLTKANEEMKKTVVFNEGFEILFGIIKKEGGSTDAGLVVQDCLQICMNILTESEICQRLFFGMGSDWILRLVDFFDPLLLESAQPAAAMAMLIDEGESSSPVEQICWFDAGHRLACAILSLNALSSSVGGKNPQHQKQIASGTSLVVPSAAFWVARKGPSELVSAGLSLLYAMVDGNQDVAQVLFNAFVKVPAPQPRKTIPVGVDTPLLQFGWKPLPRDDRKFISLPSLLVERYIFPSAVWNGAGGLVFAGKFSFLVDVTSVKTGNSASAVDPNGFGQACLNVFEKILEADSTASELLIQYVIAPPPPPALDSEFDESTSAQLEVMRPLGTLMFHLLVEGCSKVLDSAQYSSLSAGGSSRTREMEAAERAANVLAVVFVHGSQLARELCTAITTMHTSLLGPGGVPAGGHGENKALLPMLLNTAGRTARVPGGSGYSLLVAILRMLATIASGSEYAAKQMLEDPANLFVVDLASAASESAGVPPLVQVSACFFLGCCFQALTDPHAGKETPPPSQNSDPGLLDGSIANRRSFLKIIDGRVGLTRFTGMLKKPLPTARNVGSSAAYTSLFVSPGFRSFYERQVDAIRAGIFAIYTTTGNTSAGPGDPAQQQIIDMQQEKIAELEQKLEKALSGVLPSPEEAAALLNQSSGEVDSLKSSLEEKSKEILKLEESAALVLAELSSLKDQLTQNDLLTTEALNANERLRAENQELSERVTLLDRDDLQRKELMDHLQSEVERNSTITTQLREENTRLQDLLREQTHRATTAEQQLAAHQRSDSPDVAKLTDEILSLKQRMLALHEDKRMLVESSEQKDRKLDLLQAELSQQNNSNGSGITEMKQRISDLEARNVDLKQQLWELEKQEGGEPLLSRSDSGTVGKERKVSEEVLTKLTAVVLKMAGSLEVDFDDVDALHRVGSGGPWQTELDVLCGKIDHCVSTIQGAVAECSDLAESSGLYDLEGGEGSVTRFLDCCRRLRRALMEAGEKAEEGAVALAVLERTQLELEESEHTRHMMSDHLEELTEQLRVAETKAKEMKEQLSNELLLERESDNSVLKEEQSDLLEQLQREKESVLTLQKERNELLSSLDKLKEENTASLKLNEELEERFKQSEETTASMQKQLLRLQEVLLQSTSTSNEQEETIARLQRQLQDSQQAENDSSISKLKEVVDEKYQLERELAEAVKLKEELSKELNHEITVRQAVEEEIDLLRKDVLTQQESQDREYATRVSHQDQIDSLHQIDSLQQRNETLERKIVELQDSLTSEISRRYELKDELTRDTQEKLKRLDLKLIETQNSLSLALTSRYAEKKTFQRIQEQNERRIVFCQAQLTLAINSRYEVAQECTDRIIRVQKETEEQLTRLSKDHGSTAQQLSRLQQQVRSTSEEKHGLEELLRGLEQQGKAQKDEINKLKKELAEEKEIVSSLTNTREEERLQLESSLQAKLTQAVDKITSLQQEVDSLKIQLEFAEKECTEMREAAGKSDDARKASEGKWSQTLKEKDLEIKGLRARLENEELALKNSSRSSVKELEALQISLDREKELVRTTTESLTSLRHQLQHEQTTHKQQVVEMSAKLMEATAKASSQEKQVKELTKELASRQRTEQQMRREIEGIQQERRRHVDEINAIKVELEATQQMLQEAEAVNSFKAPLSAPLTSMNGSSEDVGAFVAQDLELRRLAQTADQLIRDLHRKEQEHSATVTLLKRREGEMAGVLSTLDGLQGDIQSLREENEVLNEKIIGLNKQKKEWERENRGLAGRAEKDGTEKNELKKRVSELERQLSASRRGDHHDFNSSDIQVFLKTKMEETLKWLMKVYEIPELQNSISKISAFGSSSGALSRREVGSIMDLLRNGVEQVVGQLDRQLTSVSDILKDTEIELTESKRNVKSLKDQLKNTQNEMKPTKLRTPTKTSISSKPIDENHRNGASPTAKEAARLAVELTKERRRLQTLQDEHADLLGLLAQQELEIKIFRTAVLSKLGSSTLATLEKQTERKAIELYGSYTDFRQDDSQDFSKIEVI